MGNIKSLEEIKKEAADTTTVHVTAWGTDVEIRRRVAGDDEELSEIMDEHEGLFSNNRLRAHVVRMCVVEPEFETVEDVFDCPSEGVKEVFQAIDDYSSGTINVDEAEKNFVSEEPDASDTDSPPSSDGASSVSIEKSAPAS